MPSSDLGAVRGDVAAFLKREHGLFIDGQWRPAKGQGRLAVFNPATGKQIATVASADASDVETAVGAAHEARRDGRWRGLRPADRERILLRYADLVEANADALAQLETLEQGKSIMIARHVELGAGVEYLRYAVGLATKITGSTMDISIPTGERKASAFTRREPVGVVAAITPWNFPLMIGLWKIMPSLAAGCTLVLKPSEVTTLTSLRLAELALEASVPAGVFNVITGDGAVCARALGFASRIASETRMPRTHMTPGFQDNLGWAYGTALGAKAALPGKAVVCVLGDGGFMYQAAELATAMQHNIAVIAVVFDNACFGNVKLIQSEQYGGRLIACDLTNPDFVKFSVSFGAAAYRTETSEGLQAALTQAIAAEVPAVIHVPCGDMPSPWDMIEMPRLRG